MAGDSTALHAGIPRVANIAVTSVAHACGWHQMTTLDIRTHLTEVIDASSAGCVADDSKSSSIISKKAVSKSGKTGRSIDVHSSFSVLSIWFLPPRTSRKFRKPPYRCS